MAVLVRSNSEELPKAIGSEQMGKPLPMLDYQSLSSQFTQHGNWHVVVFTTLGPMTFKHKCTIIIQRLSEIVAAS